MARLRWLRARHRLAFRWDDQTEYTYRPRRWRRPVRGAIAAAIVGVDRVLLRTVLGAPRPQVSAPLFADLAAHYAADVAALEQLLGWDLAAWRERPTTTIGPG